jgi:Fur family ferric uptake transcriptional regulator
MELSNRLQRLRDAGYKLTNARLSVLKAIEGHGGHITSSELLETLNASDPDIGRASVFRTLDLLTQLGIIRPTYIESSITPRYVLLPDGHHHHVICTSCNRVIEFEDCGLHNLSEELEQKLDMQISGHLLEFYGICKDCRST